MLPHRGCGKDHLARPRDIAKEGPSMNRRALGSLSLIAAMLVLALSGTAANAEEFQASLTGFQEIGALNASTGAILTSGTGTLRVNIDKQSNVITYTLTYSGLSAPVTQAHIHFGQRHVAGGIVAFLCTNLGNGPAGTQACPANGGTVSGSLDASDVLGVTSQNVTAGDFAALETIIQSDAAYGNIHTSKFPAGEIRGQLRNGGASDKQ